MVHGTYEQELDFRKYFKAKPCPLEEDPERQKRQLQAILAGGIPGTASLGLSIYSTIEVQQLSSNNEDQAQQITHILTAIDGLSEVVEQNALDIDEMQVRVNNITKEVRTAAAERQIMGLGHLIMNRSQKRLSALQQAVNGIFQALGSKLSPELISGLKMKKAFRDISRKAQARGFLLTASEIANVFHLPISTLFNGNGILDVIIHIALKRPGSSMHLFRMINLPFYLMEEKSFNYEITSGVAFVATDQRRTKVIEIQEKDLDECTKTDGNHFCPNLIQKPADPQDSCAITLFRAKREHIQESCELSVTQEALKVVRVNHFTAYLTTGMRNKIRIAWWNKIRTNGGIRSASLGGIRSGYFPRWNKIRVSRWNKIRISPKVE